ncbi:riboflavin biosynthesis protein RibF [Salinibacillus xinjiangensis]|uniref:Riboflavin biosynthesis protein n=1 Tax=Salinibacillus xinjiangensis TaxID=1229268 RepID=A0A6G1X2Y9_9BACI|nr:riboflavin biosynthesis protein RibF [Salinibacillus xinjiangensis]MRG85353.1 riboflavin biosynthesis protein RibF [Salinibacillus xinjiangensis]
MEVINLEYPKQFNTESMEELALAIGYFDGVHKGHQKVINEAIQVGAEKGIKSAVMTFHPHPSVVLKKEVQHVQYITPLPDKLQLLENVGVDYVFVVKFNAQLAALSPQQFVDEFLIGLNVQHVVAGFDFTYGHKGKGTMKSLPEHSRGKFTQTTISKVTAKDDKISSSNIRQKLANGNISEANDLLGRAYQLTGKVVEGDQRGRTIGFPTANISLHEDYILPKVGVYAVSIEVQGKAFKGMANIGYKPTFEEKGLKPTIEVFIFDFSGNIYNEEVKLELFDYIRGEQKFSGIDELKAQLHKDEEKIRHFFAISS